MNKRITVTIQIGQERLNNSFISLKLTKTNSHKGLYVYRLFRLILKLSVTLNEL